MQFPSLSFGTGFVFVKNEPFSLLMKGATHLALSRVITASVPYGNSIPSFPLLSLNLCRKLPKSHFIPALSESGAINRKKWEHFPREGSRIQWILVLKQDAYGLDPAHGTPLSSPWCCLWISWLIHMEHPGLTLHAGLGLCHKQHPFQPVWDTVCGIHPRPAGMGIP